MVQTQGYSSNHLNHKVFTDARAFFGSDSSRSVNFGRLCADDFEINANVTSSPRCPVTVAYQLPNLLKGGAFLGFKVKTRYRNAIAMQSQEMLVAKCGETLLRLLRICRTAVRLRRREQAKKSPRSRTRVRQGAHPTISKEVSLTGQLGR